MHDEEAVDAQYLQVPTISCVKAAPLACLCIYPQIWYQTPKHITRFALSAIVSRLLQLGPILNIKHAFTTAILWFPAVLRE